VVLVDVPVLVPVVVPVDVPVDPVVPVLPPVVVVVVAPVVVVVVAPVVVVVVVVGGGGGPECWPITIVTLEYFAARKPVLSTGIADVVAEFADVAYVADGVAAYVTAARAALDAPPERIERGAERASARTGDAIAARMLDALAAL